MDSEPSSVTYSLQRKEINTNLLWKRLFNYSLRGEGCDSYSTKGRNQYKHFIEKII